MNGRRAPSLSEQILSLTDPTPTERGEIDWFEEDETKAKVCDHVEEESIEQFSHLPPKTSLRGSMFDDDPRYAGKSVSRRNLDETWTSIDELVLSDTEGEEESSESEEDESTVDSDEVAEKEEGPEGVEFNRGDEWEEEREDEDDHDDLRILAVSKDDKTDTVKSDFTTDLLVNTKDFTTISKESVEEDIQKGKAIKNQISMWDGLLEGRIQLQKVLSLVNRLPQGDMMEMFEEQGKEPVEKGLRKCQSELFNLLCSLLELQEQLLTMNTSTRRISTRESKDGSHEIEVREEEGRDGCSDEEIPSDFSDEEDGAASEKEELGKRERETSLAGTARGRRLHRYQKEWKGSHEDYIQKIHERFVPYRNETISKWNEKLKLSSGKINSKAFLHFDRSVMAHIDHILQDRPRLRKRTQLKRTAYKILGSCISEPKRTKEDMEEDNGQLKEYDPEIFDDDDFYHQLLKELIERKTSQSNTNDPIEMGRQWLELQKIRTKVKRKVDTKASKGRKLRYQVHQKLSNFMAPMERGDMSDTARNDLFISLFGSNSTIR